MRAVRFDRFGPPEVLAVADVPEPVPAAGEVKLRVLAASLNPLDWKIRDGHLRLVPMLARPPRGTGCDIAGEIVAVGGATGERHRGERVFGSLSPFGREGSCAEFAVVAAHRVVPIPDGVAAETAAALPVAAGTALQALTEDAPLTAGQRLLVVGAAGGVGHFAVQLARHLGAHVTGMCGPANVEFVRALGADAVVDYTRGEPTAGPGRFDVVFDAANALGWHRARPLLLRGGIYVGTAGSLGAALATAVAMAAAPLFTGTRARNLTLRGDADQWRRLGEFAASGVLVPHIADRIGLEQVANAQRRMESGHGRGKIVVVPDAATAA